MSSLDSDSDSELLLGDSQQQSNQADEEWEEWAGDEGDDEEGDTTASLFAPATLLPSPEAAMAHDAAQYGFDLRQYRRQVGLDEYGTIQLINYIRSEVAAGRNVLQTLTQAAAAGTAGTAGTAATAAPWSDDAYLQPVLPDDPLLTYDYDDTGDTDVPGGSGGQQQQDLAAALAAMGRPAEARGAAGSSAAAPGSSDAAAIIAALQQQLAAANADKQELLLRVAALMEVALPAEVRQELREAAAEDSSSGAAAAAAAASSSGGAAASSSSSQATAHQQQQQQRGLVVSGAGGGQQKLGVAGRVDAAYFDSYSYFDIHHEMLSDKPRTSAYQSALTRNPSLMKGKSLLDVGCGTAILSMFGAKGGAAAVVGLDGSSRIAGFARQIVSANKLDADSGGPISIISGKVEEVDSIGRDKVDVIVSEWMGYALLFESMLDSVLAARDRWLAPGGAVLPDRASIWVAGAHEGAFGTTFWQDVYGFSMSPVGVELASSAAAEAKVLVRPVEASCITTCSKQVHAMDLVTMTADQQDFTTSFELTAAAAAGSTRDTTSSSDPSNSSSSTSSSVSVAAVVLWFDVQFSERFCKECPVTLSTSPWADTTHWVQAVLPLQTPVKLATATDGSTGSTGSNGGCSGSSGSSSGGVVLPSKLCCRLSMARSPKQYRALDISLEVSGEGVAAQARSYTMQVTPAD